ncbi:MAG: arylesterase [Burkholderiaceae bacterium]
MLTRWRLIVAVLCWFPLFGVQAREPVQAEPSSTILVIGDSLSAEYGLERGAGWVSLIAKKLSEGKHVYRVQNSSISGDTTAGGVTRLPDALKRYSPRIVVIELGSNDALRGLSLNTTEANLAKMIQLTQQSGAQAILVGMEIPPNYGREYTSQFTQMFTTLAHRHHARLVPFLLKGIATDRQQFQSDGIHPNEAAQPVLAKNVWAELEPALKP